jgi:GNAT superfamily N-acetyltransferase
MRQSPRPHTSPTPSQQQRTPRERPTDRYKITQHEWDTFEPSQCSSRLEAQREREPGPGLIAYLGDEPVAWCGVESRLETPRLFESPVTAVSEQAPGDAGVWAVRCFVVREAYRNQGVGQALLSAAIKHARTNGAHTLEGYPTDTAGETIEAGDLFRGTIGMFEGAGFDVVSRPVEGRALVSLAL